MFRGVVETVRLASGGVAGEKRRVVAGQSVRCEPRHKAIAMVAFRPETFEQSLQLTEDSGEFTGLRLGKRWTFDTPNAGNKWSLTARPGFLRIKLYNACQDSWEDRGTAPFLYTALPSPPDRFSMETYVDLATGNGGKPRHRTIGGLVVYDVARDKYALIFGLMFQYVSGKEQGWKPPFTNPLRQVRLDSPKKHHAQVGVNVTAGYLRLDRNGTVWTGYYKAKQDDAWIQAGKVSEADLSGGRPADPHIGLFAETCDRINPGGPGANIDFDYFRVRNLDEEVAR